MNSEMTVRQREAWSLAAISAPAVLLLTGLGWVWVLAGSLGAVCLRAWMNALCRNADGTLSESLLYAFGKPVGTGLLLLSALWMTLVLARTAAQANTAYPDDALGQLPGAALLALTAYCAWTGKQTAKNSAGIAAMLAAGLYALLFVSAAGAVEWAWCLPWGKPSDAWQAFAVGLIPAATLFLTQKRGQSPIGLGTAALAPAAMAFVCAGMLSPAVCVREPIPFYAAAKSLSLFSVMPRVEPLLSGAMLMGMFCLAGLLVSAASEAVRRASGLPEKWGALGICAAALAVSFFTRRLPERLWIGGATIFWGILPIAALIVVSEKKRRKKAEK